MELQNPKKYVKELKSLSETINIGGAMYSKGFVENNAFLRVFKVIGFSSYYAIARQKSAHQYNYFMANPDKA